MNEEIIVFQLDSEASVNLLSGKHIHESSLKPSDKTLVMWNRIEMKPLGKTPKQKEVCHEFCDCER